MAQVVVIVVPFPAQSHLNQLLHLSSIISSYQIPVHFVGSATHNRQAKVRTTAFNLLDITKIHFHELPTPPFLSPPPNPDTDNKFPSHLQPSFESSLQLREPVAALINEIAPTAKRVIVIHDTLMAYVVQDAASIPNAESYVFHCISAFNKCFGRWETMENPIQLKSELKELILPSIQGCYTTEMMNFLAFQYEFMKNRSGVIYNTCRLIEGAYIDLLSEKQVGGNKKEWAIGPLNPVKINERTNSNRSHKCLEWLDKQAPNSVIYVSFGTTVSMADEQIKELAIGLEKSEQKFLWILRDADRGDIFTEESRRVELPKGFEERVVGVGMVVRDWAPQVEILAHPSTGGFVSHCGWNSCMESISFGVPILAWPMHSDQPMNVVLVTQILRVGLVIKEWSECEELVSSSKIEKFVKILIGSEEGDEIRKRADELGGTIRQSKDEGGVSRMEMDSLIAHISR